MLIQQKNEKIQNRYLCGVSVVMFNVKDLELKRIDHLGIVAGIVDSIGIVEIINNLLGSEPLVLASQSRFLSTLKDSSTACKNSLIVTVKAFVI